MRKTVKVKGYFTKKGEYRKGYVSTRRCNSGLGKSKMTTSRKIIALRNYTDSQSQEYYEVMKYLSDTCPECIDLINKKHVKVSPKVKEAVNYAYDILFT